MVNLPTKLNHVFTSDGHEHGDLKPLVLDGLVTQNTPMVDAHAGGVAPQPPKPPTSQPGAL